MWCVTREPSMQWADRTVTHRTQGAGGGVWYVIAWLSMGNDE